MFLIFNCWTWYYCDCLSGCQYTVELQGDGWCGEGGSLGCGGQGEEEEEDWRSQTGNQPGE